jgi:hypothetical protein
MADTKPDKSLVTTPVEGLCGDPGKRDGGPGNTHGGEDGLPKESGGLPTVTYSDPQK